MHEAGIAESVIVAVERRVKSGEIQGRLRRVFLRVGTLQAVLRDNLEFLFGVLSRGTLLEGVELVVEPVEARGLCGGCGREFVIHELWFLCPACGSTDVALVSGDELLVAEVEIE